MEILKWYECKISHSYLAEDPADAARQLIQNIANNPNWYVSVKEINGTKEFTVDTETDEVEESK